MTTDKIDGRIPSFFVQMNLIRCKENVVYVPTDRNERDGTHYWQKLGWFENVKISKQKFCRAFRT